MKSYYINVVTKNITTMSCIKMGQWYYNKYN